MDPVAGGHHPWYFRKEKMEVESGKWQAPFSHPSSDIPAIENPRPMMAGGKGFTMLVGRPYGHGPQLANMASMSPTPMKPSELKSTSCRARSAR